MIHEKQFVAMDTPANRSEYMLLFRNTALEKRLPPEDVARAMKRLNEWLERWSVSGHLTGGQPLSDEGRTISGGKEGAVADGPFVETKESVAGYVMLRTADLDEATRIAGEWPLIDYGGNVEVRPVREQCPAMIEAGQRLYEINGR
jgi:hypothetical protein